MESHLLQMRGLKPINILVTDTAYMSHLLQMRGLKQERIKLKYGDMSRIFYRCVD